MLADGRWPLASCLVYRTGGTQTSRLVVCMSRRLDNGNIRGAQLAGGVKDRRQNTPGTELYNHLLSTARLKEPQAEVGWRIED